MSFFSIGDLTTSGKAKNALVIEVGSGSVLTAIIHSPSGSERPEIIWSHREFLPLKTAGTPDIKKLMLGALMRATLAVGNEGLAVLFSTYATTIIDTTIVTYSAPWSLTITQTAQHTADTPETITTSFLAELLETVKTKTLKLHDEYNDSHKLDLIPLSQLTTGISLNGYPSTVPDGQVAKTVTLTTATAYADSTLVGTTKDLVEKLIPNTSIELYSFMTQYYCVVRQLFSHISEYCLIDITYEATEIGIVREGILGFTHTIPVGINTLARNIAHALDIPHEHALTLIHDKDARERDPLMAKHNATFAKILDTYRQELVDLLRTTGDTLVVPKTLFLHTTTTAETYLYEEITAAAKEASGGSHSAHNITKAISAQHPPSTKRNQFSSTTLVSAYFFHTQSAHGKFIQM